MDDHTQPGNPSCSGAGRRLEYRERREWIRYPLRGTSGKLAWIENSGPASCDVSVINISGGGAALLGDRVPGSCGALTLELEAHGIRSGPLEAEMVRVSTGNSGAHTIHIRFTSWVPLNAILDRHVERRLWRRYPARERQAMLTWLEESGEKTILGEVLNISGGGVAVITEVQPPADRPVWFGLARESGAVASVECQLVGYEVDPSGLKVARFMFGEPCREELFHLVVHGERSGQACRINVGPTAPIHAGPSGVPAMGELGPEHDACLAGLMASREEV